ncbi:MAG: TonB-dependent receptor [Bacteroidetes bacterium]|nr:TonB-dependent receptor [Bacteroidota bacterium]
MRKFTKHKIFWFLLVIQAFTFSTLWAQSSCGEETLNEAKKKYGNGNFDQVIQFLQPCLTSNGFSDKQRQEAYRLLAINYIAIDSVDKAMGVAVELLSLNPNFEPDIFDPPRFIRIINDIKESGSTVLVRSVSKKAENLNEAPATVLILTDKEIRERGYTDMEALFSDLPGFDISRNYSSIYSNLYQRGYRSNETNRTIFLVDGVEENNLWSNTSYWDMQYPITNVSRVEVIYGPASTMYGANAFAGVVNVLTKEPEEITKGKSFGICAQTGYGTYNTRYGDMTVAGKYKSVSFTLTGRMYLSDEMDLSKYPEYDYDPNYYETVDYKKLLNVTSNAQKYYDDNKLSDTSALFTVVRDNQNLITALLLTDSGATLAKNYDKAAVTNKTFKGHKLGYSNLYNDWLINGKLRIGDFTLGFQRWSAIHGGTNLFNDNNISGALNGSEFAPIQNYFYGKYEKNLNDKLVITNTVQYMVHELDNETSSNTISNYSNGKRKLADLFNNKPAGWLQMYLYQISKQLRDEFKVIYTASRKVDLVSGLEVRNSLLQGNYLISFGSVDVPSDSGYVGGSTSAQGQILGGNSYDIRDIGVYAQANYKPITDVKITLGGRVDHNQIRKLGGYGTQFNPRIAVVYSPGKFVYKAIYSEAIKDADNWTKFATTEFRKLASPSLEPEKAKNLEFSVLYNPDKNLNISVNGYTTSYSGVIGTKKVDYQGGTTTQNAPIGSMSIQGIESSITYKWLDYSFFGNYTFILNGKSTESGVTSDIGDISKHKFNIGANALYFNRLNINLRLNYLGDRKTGPGTTVPANPGTFPAHTLLNMAVSYEWKWGLTFQLLCDNLTDEKYSDPGVRSADGFQYAYRTPQKERNFTIKLLYDLSQ